MADKGGLPYVIYVGSPAISTRIVPMPIKKRSDFEQLFFSSDHDSSHIVGPLLESHECFDLNLNNLPQSFDIKDNSHFNFLLNEQLKLKLQGYDTASSIHSKEGINFYKSVLKAPDSVLSILKNGWLPELTQTLDLPYRERNNSSALLNLDYMRKVFSFFSNFYDFYIKDIFNLIIF
jgi:hypothetical protein